MKNASRGLSLAAVIVSAVNLVVALLHFLVAQSSQWAAIGQLIFGVGLFPLALVLRCSLKKQNRFRWTGLVCMVVLAGVLFVSDLVAEILYKTGMNAAVVNLPWVDMVMVYSFISAIAAGGLTFSAAFLDAMNTFSHLRDSKEPLGLSTKVFWSDIMVGAFFLTAFVASFGGDHPVARLVRLLSLIGAYLVALVMSRIRSDRFDEMAQENYRHAKSKTLDILNMILLGCFGTCLIAEAVFSDFLTTYRTTVGWTSDRLIQFIFLYFGLQNIIKGLIFRKLEAE